MNITIYTLRNNKEVIVETNSIKNIAGMVTGDTLEEVIKIIPGRINRPSPSGKYKITGMCSFLLDDVILKQSKDV
jgi:hypothetical protein